MSQAIRRVLGVSVLLVFPILAQSKPTIVQSGASTTSEFNPNGDDLQEIIDQFVDVTTSSSRPILLEGGSSSNNNNQEPTHAVADDNHCTICKAEFDENSQVFTTSCSHKIHLACVDRWAAECFAAGRSSNDQTATCCLCHSKVTEGGLFGQFDMDCYNELLKELSTFKDARKECFRKYLAEINCPACNRPLIVGKELIKLAKAPCCGRTYHKPCLYRLLRDPTHHSWNNGEKSLHCLKCKNLKTIAQWKDWLNKVQ